MNEEIARLKLAELIRISMDVKGLREQDFDLDSQVALIHGRWHESPYVGASKLIDTLGIQPQVFAELFRQAYPDPNFKPYLSVAIVALGVALYFELPEEVNAMALVGNIHWGSGHYIAPLPYLNYLYYKGEYQWCFGNTVNPKGLRKPVLLSEHPTDVETPCWFGSKEGFVLCTPENAWTFRNPDGGENLSARG